MLKGSVRLDDTKRNDDNDDDDNDAEDDFLRDVMDNQSTHQVFRL